MGSTYLSSLSLQKHIRIKHMRTVNWVAPTYPQWFLFFNFYFEGVSQLGGVNMPPRDVSYFLKGWGLVFPSNSPCSHQYPIKILLFSSSSQTIPIKFLLFPSTTHQYLFIFIKFPKSSHQISLVPINKPSISFCSHQVPKKFLCSHQNAFVPMAMEDRQVSTGEHRWARRWTVRLVRDSGRVLNGVPQFVGRHGGRPTSAACGSAESPDFRPARFCGGSRADLLFARQFCAFPLAGATREKERERERENCGAR